VTGRGFFGTVNIKFTHEILPQRMHEFFGLTDVLKYQITNIQFLKKIKWRTTAAEERPGNAMVTFIFHKLNRRQKGQRRLVPAQC
jgi:hypothetical protein